MLTTPCSNYNIILYSIQIIAPLEKKTKQNTKNWNTVQIFGFKGMFSNPSLISNLRQDNVI